MDRSLPLLAAFSGFLLTVPAFAEGKLIDADKPRVAGQWIVRLHEGNELPRSFFRDADVRILHSFTSSPSHVIKVDPTREQETLEVLRQSPEVASIQANRIFHILKAPNDPNFGSQYHHNKINSQAAWEVSTGSKQVVVAIIDTGVNYKHPDIAPNYWSNPGESGVDAKGKDKSSNGLDDDGNGYIDDFRGWDFVNNDNDPDDDLGHGTHCAGIIGAKGDNGKAVSGVNWDVSLVGLKFINGKTGEGDTVGAVKAIEYAVQMGFPITSNSWGGEVDSLPSDSDEDILRDAIKAAEAKGILFIAAAGNSSSDNDKKPTLPASYPISNILSVAASTGGDSLAFFSNYGAQTVDIAAPGSNILSTVLGTGTQKMSGTSMAAPVVAGAAALLKAAHPEWKATEIKQRLLESVDVLPSLKGRVNSSGRLNVGKALEGA